MHARLTRSKGTGDIDEAIAYVESKSIPAIRSVKGCKGILYLIDRDSKRAVALTLWEDEAALRASDEEAKKIRSDAVSATSATIESVEEFEVAVQELM